MKSANYCFIPAYYTSTDQSFDTSEPVLATLGFDAWQRELNMRGEYCCNLYSNVTTDIWVWSFGRALFITRRKRTSGYSAIP